jgi:hypothetical protein
MERIKLTEEDFNDVGIVFGYQEYGGPCTMFGTVTSDSPNMALSPRNDIGVAWDSEAWDDEGPNVHIYNRNPKEKKVENIKALIKTKKELIEFLEENGIRIKENS